MKPLSKKFLIGLAFAWCCLGVLSATVDLANGLVGHWSFDEVNGTTVKDSSGNNRHGTLVNMDSATDYVDGKVNKAIDLDGSNDYVSIPHSSALDIRRTISVSMWMKVDSFTAQWMAVFYKGAGHPGRTYSLWQESTRYLHNTSEDSSGQEVANTGSIISTGNWYHIVSLIDRNGGSNKLYVNNTLSANESIRQTDTVSSSNDLRFGWSSESSSGHSLFDGKFDEVRLYNRILNTDEISHLYSTATTDTDSDGLTDAEEASLGTNSSLADTDGDGISDGDEVNGHHTYEQISGSFSWTAAKADAESRGGYLATITSATELASVYAVVSGNPWLGGTDSEQEGTWKWVTGETWSYANWGSGQPDNANNEDFLHFSGSANTWNDLPNSSSGVSGYILERVLSPTNPLQPDTDGDGVEDATEISQGRDPNYVELTGWTAVGSGNWSVQSGNTSVKQTVNEQNLFYLSPGNVVNKRIKGTLKVTTATDNDWIGFVVGHEDASNFYRFGWTKAQPPDGGGLPADGWAFVQVVNGIPATDVGNGTSTNLVSDFSDYTKGWEQDVEYEFEMIYTSGKAVLKMKGGSSYFANNPQLFSLSGNFPAGKFAFWGHSQEYITYSNLRFEYLASPTITILGDANVTHEATTAYVDSGATTTDAEDGNLTSSIQLSGAVDVNATGVYTLTYSVTDSTGIEVNATRTVTVVDTTAPTISLTGNSNMTHEAATSFSDAGATWTDTLDGNGSATVSGTVNVTAPGDYVLTYSKTDAAGNAATQVTRTVTVQDTTNPVITLTGDVAVTHEAATSYTDDGATWTDTLDGNGSLVAVGTVNASIPGTYTLSYDLNDTAGNGATQITRAVTVQDTTKPVITLAGGVTVTHEAATSYSDAGATWTDTLDGNGTLVAVGNVNENVPDVYVLTYDFTDAAGNAADRITRTVTVQDTTQPVIALTGSATVTHEAATVYTDGGATWTDTLDGNGTLVAVGTVNASIPGTYTLSYDLNDTAGNGATQVTRTVTVQDTTKPVITLTGDAAVTHEAATSYADGGATWTDTLDGNGTIVAVGSVNENAPGAYVLTYDFTDAAGNAADQVTRTVTVQDTTKPVITLTGDAAVTHEAATSYTDAGATWTDTLDGNGTLVAVGSVNENLPGAYVLTYDVTDAAGNAADQVTRTVTVVDTTRPVITLTGDASVTHEAATSYSDAGATWSDTLDGNGTIVAVGAVNENLPGAYVLTYDVTDAAGNTADQVRRTVTVVDTTKPVITLTGDAAVTHEAATSYSDGGATWTDTLDGNGSLDTNGTVNPLLPGVYSLAFGVADAAGNAASEVTRAVTVVDTTNPVITLEGNATIRHRVWRSYLDPGALASDTLDGNLTNKISTTNPVDASVPGTYEVSYAVSDAAGNAATVVTRSVVVFNEAPSGLLLSNASVEENLPSGALIGTFSTEDPDDADGSKSYVYTKISGNGLTVSTTGVLSTSEAFDFESSSSHEIVVRTTDEFGAFLEKTFTISVIDAFVPGVDTAPATEVTGISSVLHGSIADAGDSQGVTERGFVFGRSPDPETSGGSTLAAGIGSGAFTASATKLTPGRVYYFKAYARNAEGVSYGSQERFTTPQDRSSALWSDATASGANWRSSDWFGSFYLTDTPWLYHGELGWLYASGTSSSSVWLWTESLGWVWTGKETFPYLYRDADADTGWYHWNGTVNGRSLFYRYSDSQWIDFPLGGNAEAYK